MPKSVKRHHKYGTIIRSMPLHAFTITAISIGINRGPGRVTRPRLLLLFPLRCLSAHLPANKLTSPKCCPFDMSQLSDDGECVRQRRSVACDRRNRPRPIRLGQLMVEWSSSNEPRLRGVSHYQALVRNGNKQTMDTRRLAVLAVIAIISVVS